MELITYDHLVPALGARVNFFGVEGAQEHAFRMYTLPDAMRIREHILQKWQAADRDPALIDDGALNVVIVGARPTGVESAGALAELYRSNFAKDYPGIPRRRPCSPRRGGPTLFSMFQPKLPGVREGCPQRSGASTSSSEEGRRVHGADQRHPAIGHRAERTHARLGAGCRRILSPPPSASIPRRETGSRSAPTSASRAIPRSSPWVTSRGSPTLEPTRSSRSSARSPSSPEDTREPTSRGRSKARGQALRLQGQGRWPRSAARRRRPVPPRDGR